MQIVNGERLNAIDQGAQPRPSDLKPEAMPAAEGDVGPLFVASRILFTGSGEVEIRMRHVLDGPVDARRQGQRPVESSVAHAQIHCLVGLEIPVDMERQAGKATGVRCAFAGQFGADIHLDHTVGEVAMHDGKARRVGTARLPQATLLLILGELDRQAVGAIPPAARRDHQIDGDRLRHHPFGSAVRRHDDGAHRCRGRTLEQAAPRQRAEMRHSFHEPCPFGFTGKRKTLGSRTIIDQMSNCDLS
jgi:hypothetical protein